MTAVFSVEELLNENALLDEKSGDEIFENQFSNRLSPKFNAAGQVGIDSTPTRQRTSTSSEMSSPHSPVFTNTPYVRGNVTATLSNESAGIKNLDEQSTLANDDETYHEIELDTEQGSKRDNDETESSMKR